MTSILICHHPSIRHIYVTQFFVFGRYVYFGLKLAEFVNMEEQGSSGPRVSNDKRLAQTQAKVDEVVGIMRVNVEKVLERDHKLSELDNRADNLQNGAAQFEQQAGKLKRKYWWQNLKMMLIIGAIGAVLLIIIIVWATSGSGDGHSAVAPPPENPSP